MDYQDQEEHHNQNREMSHEEDGRITIANLFMKIMTYIIEGSAVAVAAYLIPSKKLLMKEVVMIALTAAAVFALLDLFAPAVGISTRQGAGFGLGAGLIGFPGIIPGVPPM